MEQRGLVTRERCPDDARGSIVRLTPAGRSAIEAAAPNHVATVRRFFLDLLADDELDTLATLFDRLLAGLAETED
jgi:DNA-binding MarR family transcriptional regulator